MRIDEQLIAFENRIASLWEQGELPFLLHLCGGNEQQLVEIFERFWQPGDWVLASHRCHYHYLLTGGTEADLEQRIREGKSMFLFDRETNFMSTSILGGLCGVAAGIALGIRYAGKPNSVLCFLGDGASDNGHLYEAVSFCASLQLPCRFVIEDNDRSVTATKQDRHATYAHQWPACVIRYTYTPTYPHAGNGTAKRITFKTHVMEPHQERQAP